MPVDSLRWKIMSKQQSNDKRPLSPHLSIYKLPLSAKLSISHRFSGLALYAGAILLAWWIIANVYGCASCINPIISSPVGTAILVLWSLALFYHMLNGIRHLFWDMGKGLEIKDINKTGILVIICAIVMTILSWFSGIFM